MLPIPLLVHTQPSLSYRYVVTDMSTDQGQSDDPLFQRGRSASPAPSLYSFASSVDGPTMVRIEKTNMYQCLPTTRIAEKCLRPCIQQFQ